MVTITLIIAGRGPSCNVEICSMWMEGGTQRTCKPSANDGSSDVIEELLSPKSLDLDFGIPHPMHP